MDKESFPDYKLGVEYRDVDAEDNMLMFTVSVALPIWRKKNSAAVREAEKMKVSSEASREAAKQKNALDIQESLFNLQTAQRKLVLIRTELLPQAEARFRASEVAYRTGKVDFMDFLESERFRLNTKTMAAMEEGSAGMQAAGSFQPAIGRGAGQGDALLGAKEVDLGPAELWRWCANPVERRQAGRGIGRSTR